MANYKSQTGISFIIAEKEDGTYDVNMGSNADLPQDGLPVKLYTGIMQAVCDYVEAHKAGKAMDQFLREFKRTTCWDVDRLLNIEKQSINGSFYPADLFKHNDTIYLLIDTQHRKMFEENNPDAVEITYGEMEKAIEEYNKK